MNLDVKKTGARVVLLVGPQLWHKNTCATIIESSANVVGIFVANQNTKKNLPIKYFLKSIRRRGVFVTVSQTLGRLLYDLFNKKHDQKCLKEIFNESKLNSVLDNYNGEVDYTEEYHTPQTVEKISLLQPDIIVVHSPYWVDKKVRKLSSTGIVLGGHPGLTPHYRGAHSAFWALYRGRPQDVGYSVFHLNAGVDTGPLVTQGRLAIEKDDSFVTLGWKGMKAIAEHQANQIQNYDAGIGIPSKPHDAIPKDSEFPLPSLLKYIKYWMKYKTLRQTIV